MLDHKIDKIFWIFFLIGLLVVLISFFYDRWFIISTILGITLMTMGLVRRGIKFSKRDTFISFININRERIVYIGVIVFAIVAVVTFWRGLVLYTLRMQFFGLIKSSLYSSWWIFVLFGLIMGVLILSLVARIQGGNKKTVKSYKMKTEVGEVKDKPSFFLKINKLIQRARKSPVKKVKKKIVKDKPIKKNIRFEKKKNIDVYRLLTLASYFVAIISLLILVMFNRKARIPNLDLYIWITLALLISLFALSSLLRLYNSYSKNRVKVDEEKDKTIRGIKRSVVDKTNKYNTDIDTLYELINKKGKLTISEVCKGFGVTKEMAEEWGKILEEHDLIRLNYPPFGELELCKK